MESKEVKQAVVLADQDQVDSSRLLMTEPCLREMTTKKSEPLNMLVRLKLNKFLWYMIQFSQLTRQRPELILYYIMIEVTKELVAEFNAVTAFTSNDEITLVFPTHMRLFGGNVTKIVARITSFAVCAFTRYYEKTLQVTSLPSIGRTPRRFVKDEELIAYFNKKFKMKTVYFDIDVIYCEDADLDLKLWTKTPEIILSEAVTKLSRYWFTNKTLKNINTQGKLDLLEAEVGFILTPDEISIMHGTLVKRQEITDLDVEASRRRTETVISCFDQTTWLPLLSRAKCNELILAKYFKEPMVP